jgi:hypothetical protein
LQKARGEKPGSAKVKTAAIKKILHRNILFHPAPGLKTSAKQGPIPMINILLQEFALFKRYGFRDTLH